MTTHLTYKQKWENDYKQVTIEFSSRASCHKFIIDNTKTIKVIRILSLPSLSSWREQHYISNNGWQISTASTTSSTNYITVGSNSN